MNTCSSPLISSNDDMPKELKERVTVLIESVFKNKEPMTQEDVKTLNDYCGFVYKKTLLYEWEENKKKK